MFWGDPASQFFVGKKRPKGLPRTATRGKEIQQKLPNDPAKTPPYFVSCFDPDDNTAFYSAYKITPEQATNLGKFSQHDINVRSWRTSGIFYESFLRALVKQTRKYIVAKSRTF